MSNETENQEAVSPRRTRQQSRKGSQERRNSVSDIADYFISLSDQSNQSPMAPKKAMNKLSKEKEKERKLEIKQTRENIKTMIEGLNDNLSANANGDGVNEKALDHEGKDNSRSLNGEEEMQTPGVNGNSVATQTNDEEILKAIKELADKYSKLEADLHDPKTGISDQLAKTQHKLEGVYSDIHGAVSGLEVRMKKVTEIANANVAKLTQISNAQNKLGSLLDENKRLVQELQVMQGLVQKVSQQTTHNSTQLLDITKRGMEQNIVIYGVDNSIEVEDPKMEPPRFSFKERCKHSALKFFTEIMRVEIEIEDIWKAHRMGPYKSDKVRPLILKLSYAAKDLVMENLTALKGRKNPKTQQTYFISEQIPEGVVETRKQVSSRLKTLKNTNEKKPKEQRATIQVIGDKILVNGEVDTPEVKTPQPSELFVDVETQAMLDEIQSKMVETTPEVIRNSEFTALALRVSSVQQVQQAYIAAAQRYPSSDHIMMAYALKEGDQLKAGACDDREYGAGSKLRNILFEEKSKNTAVFVLRKYGGVHLGFNRFAVIEKVAKNAINMLKEIM